MCMNDVRDQVRAELEAAGVGCATAHILVDKLMKIVNGVANDAYFKGQRDMADC